MVASTSAIRYSLNSTRYGPWLYPTSTARRSRRRRGRIILGVLKSKGGRWISPSVRFWIPWDLPRFRLATIYLATYMVDSYRPSEQIPSPFSWTPSQQFVRNSARVFFSMKISYGVYQHLEFSSDRGVNSGRRPMVMPKAS